MRKSIFFLKKLTSAEVGETKTHEKYVRLPNDFDYESFFPGLAKENGNVIQVDFTAKNCTIGHSSEPNIALKFVFYANSNHEKRMPSLSDVFTANNVQADDVVCIESRTKNGETAYYITFSKSDMASLNPAAVTYSIITEDAISEDELKKQSLNLQQIYYGAPGTGKSYKINEITKSTKNFTRTTFHPDSDYSTFVGCYKPTMEPTGTIVGGKEQTKISYSYVAQAFLQAYTAAWKNTSEPYYLIIEEINRGNCAQIFGDLFQLLDRDENGMSSYGITPDKDIANYLRKEFVKSEIENADIKNGNTMMLPSNLYILATMNTSDQSLFPIDSAFKRRWDWEYVPIEDAGKKHYIKVGNKKYDWWTFIDTINNSIDHITGSEDKKMGYWFVKPQNNDREITAKQFVGKVLFYLWNDVYKDYFDMSQCIFKIKNEDGTDEKKPFTYFFGNEADKRIQAFMAYNKIPFITIEDNVDDEDNDDNEIDAEGNAVADSATQTKRRNLWVLFNQKMSAMGRSEANKEAMTLSHYDIRFKTSAFRIKNTVHVVPNTSSPASVYSEICIRPKALWIYNQLEPKKDELQGLFEEDVVWRGDGDSHTAKIEHLANFDTEEGRDAAMQWLAETSAKLYDYLKPIVDENK